MLSRSPESTRLDHQRWFAVRSVMFLARRFSSPLGSLDSSRLASEHSTSCFSSASGFTYSHQYLDTCTRIHLRAQDTKGRPSVAHATPLAPVLLKNPEGYFSDKQVFTEFCVGRNISGSGILTGCPSATSFDLVLGPTNPTPIAVAWETLVLRCVWFSHTFHLLI